TTPSCACVRARSVASMSARSWATRMDSRSDTQSATYDSVATCVSRTASSLVARRDVSSAATCRTMGAQALWIAYLLMPFNPRRRCAATVEQNTSWLPFRPLQPMHVTDSRCSDSRPPSDAAWSHRHGCQLHFKHAMIGAGAAWAVTVSGRNELH